MDIQALFERKKDTIYLNNASSGPLPLSTRNTLKELIDELAFGDKDWDFWCDRLDDFRDQSSKLIGSDRSEICFVPNTSTGLLVALYTIPWQDGDNLVFMEDGFPANRVPWVRNLPHLEKRQVPVRGNLPLEDRLMKAVDENTRALIIDWVDFFTGYRVDLKLIGDFCKEKGIFLVVDAIQGVGAMGLDMSKVHVDFLSAGSAKWMFGPVGAGILYIRKGVLEELCQALQGWMCLDWRNFDLYDPLPPCKNGAGVFEVGSYPGLPLVGLVENLKLLNKVGMDRIEAQILKSRQSLLQSLDVDETEIISPTHDQHTSGILTFKNKDPDGLYKHLSSSNVVVSLRKQAIRMSPHFYNTSHEIERALEIMGNF